MEGIVSVKSKVAILSNLTDDAYLKLLNAMSISSTHLKNLLDSTTYATYLTIPEDNHDDINAVGYIPDESLTTNGLLRRNIESAHACFLLYYGIPSLKEVSLGAILFDKQTFGKGEYEPSDQMEIERLRKQYLSMGESICTDYTLSGNVKLVVI